MRHAQHSSRTHLAPLAPLAALAALLLACQPPAERRATAEAWQVDPRPSLTVTSDRLPEGHELNGVHSALELPDGSLLLANSGAGELLLVDSTGQYKRAIGRRGQGPGEYADNLHLFQGRADTMVVYDGAGLRWTYLTPTPALDLARTVVEYNAEVPSPTWLYQGALVTDAVIRQARSRARQVIDRLRSEDPDYQYLFLARQDAQGALWVRRLDHAREWEVYPNADSTGARVTLPPGFDLIAIGRNTVVGVTRDSLGEEMVEVHRLERPVAAVTAHHLTDEQEPTASVEESPLARQLVRLVTAQESYYADHATYADHPDSLRTRLQGDFRLFILVADRWHWAGVGVLPKTGMTCAIYAGYPTPASWQEGVPYCSEK